MSEFAAGAACQVPSFVETCEPVTEGEREQVLARFVGRSAAAEAVRRSLACTARTDATVLIHGPSGTGKELAARIVHDLSARKDGRFLGVDCGGVAESVLESELFGHARGAFTSAVGERRGLFEEASGGTLFLDEVANTSLAFQARLLRVLQEREVRPVGSSRPVTVDVRVVAATNRDLAAEVLCGRFREDLLYRLDVLQVVLPPLAGRRDDVPLLARRFVEALGRRTGRRLQLAAETCDALLAHEWPGNVRELQNALERAAAFCADGTLRPEHLPRGVLGGVATPPAPPPAFRGLAALMLDYERRVLCDRLESNRWNRTRTALELGLTRRGLFNKIARHGLRPDAGVGRGTG